MDKLSSSAPCEDAKTEWSQFSQWVHCLAVVTFDLELGQAMEVSSVYLGYYSGSVNSIVLYCDLLSI